jgi:hypothetical protein
MQITQEDGCPEGASQLRRCRGRDAVRVLWEQLTPPTAPRVRIGTTLTAASGAKRVCSKPDPTLSLWTVGVAQTWLRPGGL